MNRWGVGMSVVVRSVHIENFRSIRSMSVTLSPFSILVGKNDSGKSNILRALNLFFNDQTNHHVRFSFDEDYNLFAPTRKRKAKEIIVKIELEPPASYKPNNGDIIIWEKRWRREGLVYNEYYGVKLINGKRGGIIREKVDISDKSNIHSLLRKIEYEYIPAVKDSSYFDDLRGRIYNIIAEVAAKTFRESSSAFEDSIGDHLSELTESIYNALGYKTKLALPRDLSPIFERLDFLGGEQSVSLENRGDGIKSRHIPLILKFMAEKKRSLQVRGSQPPSFIWGYEEPENNLEFASAIGLADELQSIVSDGTAQIVLTTHSPVFYDLGKSNTDININYISRCSDADGTLISRGFEQVDESMGTLALFSSRVSDLVSGVREQEKAKLEAWHLSKERKCKIFVEGESDRILLRKAIAAFFPDKLDHVDFITKRSGAGHNFVIDMLHAWRWTHKHEPSKPKSVGIVDGDAAAEKKSFNENPHNILSARCYTYPKAPHILPILKKGIRIPIDLESMYGVERWREADGRGFLEPRTLMGVIPDTVNEAVLRGEMAIREFFDDEWAIMVENKFRADTKIKFAESISRIDDDKFKTEFSCLGDFCGEILTYLENS